LIEAIHIIGGGLAGSEAAWQAAEAGVRAVLHEMRPLRPTEAHQTDALAELVCSNSLRSDDAENNAVGLLHEEMRRAGSVSPAPSPRRWRTIRTSNSAARKLPRRRRNGNRPSSPLAR
jgi:methylenetetrahydrofolate--tRNA-(uracil-5-)-methyltransferase